ncbi:GFA family protein, partial [Alphaproteobacteria bacterium]|nr:GFA family protein [Alphaproteobacteria bacterium]
MIQGSCLCRSVSFKIYKETRKAVICHCTMCQKSNGEFSSYTKTKLSNFKLIQKLSLRWYYSSKDYRRGFC